MRDLVQLEAVVLERLEGGLVALLDEALDLCVDFLGRALRAGELGAAAEVAVALLAEGDHAELVGHAVLRDHGAGDACGLLDVVGGTGGHLAEDELFGRTATAEHRDLVLGLLARGEEVLVLLDLHREAERPGRARDDRDLGDGRGALLGCGDDGVAGLVVGDDVLLVLGQDRGLLLLAGDDHVDGLDEVLLVHAAPAKADGAEGGLVDDVGEVGTRGAGCGAGDDGEVVVRLHLDVVGVDLEDGLAAGEVGELDGDAAVKAAGAQERLVEGLGTVGRREDHDALVVVEAVHLGEELVQGLLALVVGVD